MKAIGLDIGTTSICGILLDANTGEIEKKLEEKNDTWIVTASSWEKLQNPHTILKKVRDILEKLLCEHVVSIGVTGQMHGILYVDEAGRAVSPLYTWQDERGNLAFEGSTYAEHVSSYSGYGSVTHFYNCHNGLIPENACALCTISDYVAMQLAGRHKPLIHTTNAAGLGQYDLEKNTFTIEDSFLPQIALGYETIGQYQGIPVSVAIGDNQAGFLGSTSGKNCVLVNVGTGSQVSAAILELPLEGIVGSKKGIYDHRAIIEIRPYMENSFLLVGSSLCGGRAYAILENFFRKTLEMLTGQSSSEVYEQMQRALVKEAALQKADIPVFDTRFLGTRANPSGRGSIRNLSPENFLPQYFITGLLKGMSEELYDMYVQMGVSCDRMIGSGNGIRKNPLLENCIEDTFGIKMQIPVHKEEACFGAAIFSLVAAGVYSNISQAQERLVHYDKHYSGI